MKEKLLSLLREKPRTLEELSKLTGHSTLSIKWHLLGLPVEERTVNGMKLIALKGSIREKDESYHILSHKRKPERGQKSKKTAKTTTSGLPSPVDHGDHGWLTKPLTLDDYTILSTLPPTAVKILRLLYLGYTQAQIARKLKMTKQAVNKHVKKLLNYGFIRRRGSLHGPGKNRDVVYDVRKAVAVYLNLGKKRTVQDGQPDNNWGVSAPQKPLFSIHRLQLAFPIVTQSQPFPTNVKSFIRTYHPRGWTGYVYIIGNVRIRALPHKVIAEITEDVEFDEPISAEEAVIRVIEMLKSAVEKWLDEISDEVELELAHPYILNAPEFAFKSRLIKQYISKLREQKFVTSCTTGMYPAGQQGLDVWIDASPEKEGESEYAHLETNDPDVADLLDSAIKKIAMFPVENFTDLQQYMSKVEVIHQDVQNLKALIESGLSIQQQLNQLMSVVAYLLRQEEERRKQNEELKRENKELKKKIAELEKMLREAL